MAWRLATQGAQGLAYRRYRPAPGATHILTV